eukprot:TRINITY_DN16311_c0_g1_i1.p1 TRINITY_DN16311_c0_g1~~TRINITY_DN16311_c0_g1_i1.p1  ORF type:complete len:323 (-),score=81.03 TRINITY_DN16311_c0_g1_i1:118-1086(-)
MEGYNGTAIPPPPAPSPEHSSDCYESASWLAIGFGLFITFGICVSFVPQHYAFIRNKSSKGVSVSTIMISNVAAWTVFLTGVLTSWEQIMCCTHLEFWQIHITLLPLYSLFTPVINYIIIFALMIAYHNPHEDDSGPRQALIMKCLVAVYFLIIIGTSIAGVVLLWATGAGSPALKSFVFGLFVVTFSSTLIQWLPQIWETFKTKTGGELSMLMLAIQAPGTAMIAIFQGVAYDQNFVVWGPYLVTTAQMSFLIALIIYYDRIINPKTKATLDSLSHIPDEESFLARTPSQSSASSKSGGHLDSVVYYRGGDHPTGEGSLFS